MPHSYKMFAYIWKYFRCLSLRQICEINLFSVYDGLFALESNSSYKVRLRHECLASPPPYRQSTASPLCFALIAYGTYISNTPSKCKLNRFKESFVPTSLNILSPAVVPWCYFRFSFNSLTYFYPSLIMLSCVCFGRFNMGTSTWEPICSISSFIYFCCLIYISLRQRNMCSIWCRRQNFPTGTIKCIVSYRTHEPSVGPVETQTFLGHSFLISPSYKYKKYAL